MVQAGKLHTFHVWVHMFFWSRDNPNDNVLAFVLRSPRKPAFLHQTAKHANEQNSKPKASLENVLY